MVSRSGAITSVRQAAAVCNADAARCATLALPRTDCRAAVDTPAVARGWELTDPDGRRRGPQAPHGTPTRWLEGCDCDACREAQNEAARARFRRRAQERLPVEKRRQLLDCIYNGKPFRAALTDLGLTSNQVWGLAKTDEEWSAAVEAALMAAHRNDLEHDNACPAAHAASVEHISVSVWLGTGANPASDVRAVLVGCLTASPVSSPRRADQGEAAQDLEYPGRSARGP